MININENAFLLFNSYLTCHSTLLTTTPENQQLLYSFIIKLCLEQLIYNNYSIALLISTLSKEQLFLINETYVISNTQDYTAFYNYNFQLFNNILNCTTSETSTNFTSHITTLLINLTYYFYQTQLLDNKNNINYNLLFQIRIDLMIVETQNMNLHTLSEWLKQQNINRLDYLAYSELFTPKNVKNLTNTEWTNFSEKWNILNKLILITGITSISALIFISCDFFEFLP